ncbi:MAG: crossover junction endodeoxyribonuclease RuvC [Thermomicrobiales bacterium]
MIIFGVDPGTARMGFGVIEYDGSSSQLIEHGVLETSVDTSMPYRLRELYEQLTDLMGTHNPAVVAIEALFFARNVTTAISVGQARGIVLLAAAMRDLAVHEYSPSEIKYSVAGYGKADKPQMQEMVRMILGLAAVPHPDDAADAVAVAICHAHHSSGYGAFVDASR